jgi:Family of unknown function (DUF5677)
MATLKLTQGLMAPTSELATSILEKARLVANEVTIPPIPTLPHDSVVSHMFWRSIRLYDGICSLLQRALPEEAMMLGRALFEEALRLTEIAESGDARAALLLWWEYKSLKEKIGLHEVAKALGLDSPWGDIRAATKSYRELLAKYRHAQGIKKLRPFRDVKIAAMRYGRAHDYWAYSLSHEMVHGSDAYFLFGPRNLSPILVNLSDRTRNPAVIFAVANFSVRSILQAAKAVATVFGPQNTSKIDTLFETSTELEERFAPNQPPSPRSCPASQ